MREALDQISRDAVDCLARLSDWRRQQGNKEVLILGSASQRYNFFSFGIVMLHSGNDKRVPYITYLVRRFSENHQHAPHEFRSVVSMNLNTFSEHNWTLSHMLL